MSLHARIDPVRLGRVYQHLESSTGSGRIASAALVAGRGAEMTAPRFFGRIGPDAGDPPIAPDALFLIASLTKPVTATAVMLLVERGEVALDDRVADLVPNFAGDGKRDVRLRHLLTHTSGLPDMLPDMLLRDMPRRDIRW